MMTDHLASSLPASACQPVERWAHLQYYLYFNVRDIKRLLLDEESRRKVIDYFVPLRASKVYLEYAVPTRTGDVTEEQIAEIIPAFQQAGMDIAGALVPSRAGGIFCYETQDHLEMLRAQSERLARRCDEIIIDDWLFTMCSCTACVTARGARSWAEYRCALLIDRARTHILEPARAINPRVQVIIKFPNWWEGFHHCGYALEEQVRQFPAYCQGIETRNRVSNAQHIPTYTGYFLQRWTEKIDPAKRVSCWFDNCELHNQPDIYLAQVYQGVLGGSRAMVVWSGGTHYSPKPDDGVFPALARALPALDRLAGLLPREATGTATYIPYASDGEYHLPGYLGMLGIPIDPTPNFPEEGQTVILTLHSAKDPRLVERILARLVVGREVVMTWRLYQRLRGAGLDEVLQVIDDDGYVSPHALRVHDRSAAHWNRWTYSEPALETPLTFKKIRITTWPDPKTISGISEDGDFGILFSARYLDGKLHVLNVPENTADLLRLPQAALKVLRRICTPDAGMVLDSPANVAWYQYGAELFVLHNMNATPATINMTFHDNTEHTRWKEIFHELEMHFIEDDMSGTFSVNVPAGEMGVFRREKGEGRNFRGET